MLLSLIKLFGGYLHVTLTGRAPERFLNICVKNDILIWNLCRNKEMDGYDFCISVQGFRASAELLKKTHTSMKIRKKCGLPFFFHRYRARKLFGLGLLLCLVFLGNCSRYVWKIEVNGALELSEDMICSWLETQGQTYGTKKSQIDCAALEIALRSEFDVIAWTSVKLEGTKLTVDIQERLPETEANTEIPTDGAWDIVAAEDTVITSIYTRRGTPRAETGMTVSKGAVLISGKLEIFDDSGMLAATHYVTSDGDVTGTVTRSYEASFPMNYQKKTYTGAKTKNYVFQFWNVRLPFGKEESYPACETTVLDRQLELLPGFFLPVHLYTTTRRAYIYQPKTYTKAEVETIAESGWSLFLEKFTEKGIPIIVKNVKIETNEKNCTIRGNIEAELPVASYAPTPLEPESTQEQTETD